jgi:hypothetical protein
MSNQYYNFYYDPIRQGYDLNTWSTISGTPVVVSNQLELNSASIIHFADILRGDATFSVKIGTPVAGDVSKFGFYDLNQASGLGFEVADDVFTANSFTPEKTTTTVLDWNTAWDGANTQYQIMWEAGRVIFKINGQVVATVSDTSVPGSALNLYLISTSVIPLSLNYINVKGVQNLIWS